jgi:hypothetical protein
MEGMPRAQMTKTDVPGVYKRGERYAYTYRKRGRQRWGTARTKAEARRLKHQAETDVARGEHRDSTRLGFGEYARAWIAGYQGRTAAGVRPETRDWYRQMLDDRLIPYFDVETGLLLSEIEPRDIKSLVAWLAEQPNPARARAHPRALDRRLPRRRAASPVRRRGRGRRRAQQPDERRARDYPARRRRRADEGAHPRSAAPPAP